MKKGEFSKAPVKTQFGYHIIYLEDIKSSSTISFKEAKAQIEQMLKKQGFSNKLQSMITDLKSKADIKIK
jgi:parvulin-like peptidyl-prolyl isomerase